MVKKRGVALRRESNRYAGAIVLGLNDALVELTAALTGFTFALQQSKIVALTGFITGVAAALSMAASEYLSAKEEVKQNKKKDPLKSSLYTGITYIITVLLLILPYFLFSQVYVALASMLFISFFIIFCYTYYLSTLKEIPFWKRFREMALLSLSVALISFLVGLFVRRFMGI